MHTEPDLHALLRTLLERQRRARYRGWVLSVEDHSMLHRLIHALRELLPADPVWQAPGETGAPSLPCPWSDFVDQVLRPTTPDLILCQPETWLVYGSPLEQSNFWSQLATTFGRRRVIVLVVEKPLTLAQLDPFFIGSGSPAPGLRGWRSRREAPTSAC